MLSSSAAYRRHASSCYDESHLIRRALTYDEEPYDDCYGSMRATRYYGSSKYYVYGVVCFLCVGAVWEYYVYVIARYVWKGSRAYLLGPYPGCRANGSGCRYR